MKKFHVFSTSWKRWKNVNVLPRIREKNFNAITCIVLIEGGMMVWGWKKHKQMKTHVEKWWGEHKKIISHAQYIKSISSQKFYTWKLVGERGRKETWKREEGCFCRIGSGMNENSRKWKLFSFSKMQFIPSYLCSVHFCERKREKMQLENFLSHSLSWK